MVYFREKERKVGPDGFVDSTRHRNKYVVGGEKKGKKDSESGGGSGGSGGSGGKGKMTVVDMAAKKEKDQRDYEKRIKLIEVSYFHEEICLIWLLYSKAFL